MKGSTKEIPSRILDIDEIKTMQACNMHRSILQKDSFCETQQSEKRQWRPKVF